MGSSRQPPHLGIAAAIGAQTACGAALGMIAAAWIGAAFLALFGLIFGAIVGLVLSPIAILMFRPEHRVRAICVALVCATIGVLLCPTPRLLGPALMNAAAGWIGALAAVRLTMSAALATDSEPRFALRVAPLVAIAGVVFGALFLVRSWSQATDSASALRVVNNAFRSNAMEVHPLGHEAFAMITEADAQALSRDADDRVRYQVARALTHGQSDEFARATLDRLATDSDWLTRLEAYWSMARRWPDERDAIATRMRTDAHPNIRDAADRVSG